MSEKYSPGHSAIFHDSMIFPCGLSRSGTTLLSAVLDAHTQICMGYEMLFPSLPGVGYIVEQLNSVYHEAGNLQRAGSLLRKRGLIDLGKWISRCHRLGLDFDGLLSALHGCREDHGNTLGRLEERLRLIKRVIDMPEVRKGSTHTGFKITDDMYETYFTLFPQAMFIYILRDPRDVYASLNGADFGVSLSAAGKRWTRGLESFKEFQKKHSEQCLLVRYEDLVADPAGALAPVFAMAGLEMEDGVLEFQKSKARILASTHPNAGNLKKGFFVSSVSRYLEDLSVEDTLDICNSCGDLMRSHGYLTREGSRLGGFDPGLYKIPDQQLEKKMATLNAKVKFGKDDYVELLKPYIDENYEVMPLLDFIREKDIGDRKILIIRHDIDHNHLTAMKMAKWEHDHGIRSTYCILHTAWYYGQLENEVMRHTTDLVDCVKYLAGLGHEITLHNNIAVTALKENIDPVAFLRQELDFFSAMGIQIKGTSTHGDVLCRDLNFRNYELFHETCDGRYGGPRTILHEQDGHRATVTLGEVSMYDFGLEYEAYEIFWDIYHTDSGGRFQSKTNRKGMRHFGRSDQTRGALVGILAHPVWWKF